MYFPQTKHKKNNRVKEKQDAITGSTTMSVNSESKTF